jgi:hypothetical protein
MSTYIEIWIVSNMYIHHAVIWIVSNTYIHHAEIWIVSNITINVQIMLQFGICHMKHTASRILSTVTYHALI